MIDGGSSFYAPQSFTDAQGRRIMLGWLREMCPDDVQVTQGWSGAMSLPRELSMAEDGSLRQSPAPEVEQLRSGHQHLNCTAVDWFRHVDLGNIHGNCLEISARFGWTPQAMVAFSFCGSDDESERTVISLSVEDNEIVLDTTASSAHEGISGERCAMPAGCLPGEPVALRVFVDVSVIEVFLGDRVCLTSRIYPVNSNDFRLHVSSTVDGEIDIYGMLAAM
jgi:beta-fructofuranosidase